MNTMTDPLVRIAPDYAARRAAIARHIGPKGVAIIPTAPEQQRNRDADFLYRADSYFFYLSGFTEPHSWLVLCLYARMALPLSSHCACEMVASHLVR
jgi:Xaa-Pro aminopeptidase